MTSDADGSRLKRSTYHVFELAVDKDWRPRAVDGEVCRFVLWDMDTLEAAVRTTDATLTRGEEADGDTVTKPLRLQPAMALVMCDFLIRHGVVTAATEGADDFAALCAKLRAPRALK